MKESEVQRWVQDFLKKRVGPNLYIFKVPMGQYTSRRGLPDLVMSMYGQFVAIEVKTDVGRLSPLQENEIKTINACGGLATTIYGKDQLLLERLIEKVKSSCNTPTMAA